MTPPIERVRFTFVDALRGVAASAVVLFHAVEGAHITELYQAMPAGFQVLLRHGDFGVAIFFVLSGFVIAHSLGAAQLSLTGVLQFLAKRSIRLDPPYWAAIALAILFSVLASKIVAHRPAETFSVPQVASHLFYLQALLGFKQINSVFWTLCLEIQFYTVYALLLWTRSTWAMIAAFFIALLWPIGLGPAAPGVFVEFWYAFLLGVGAQAAWRNVAVRPGFLAYVAVITVGSLYSPSHFALVCCSTAVSLFGVAIAGQLASWLNWRWLQFLGTISYSLYLIHNPVTGAAFRAGYLITGRNIYTEALWWIASLAACIGVATLFWYFIERPSAKWASRFGKKFGAPRDVVITAAQPAPSRD